MLRIALESEGFVVVSGHVDEIRRGGFALSELMREHDPAVIIYDLVPPYDHSWRFLEHMRKTPDVRNRAVVVTSTNPERAKELAGTNVEVLEIVGKPYDLNRIVDAVKVAAAKGRALKQAD